MILCGFRDQIEVLSTLTSFKVDMTYKRIQSNSMNEVLFATFLPDECKSMYYSNTWKVPAKQLTPSYYIIPCVYQHGFC